MALAGNLDVIAAAVERLSAVAATAASYDHSAASNASKSKSRPKLVLPSLTSAMEQDFILSKGPGANPTKPLSITLRPEFADYPLVGIVEPHTHDVRKLIKCMDCSYYILIEFISHILPSPCIFSTLVDPYYSVWPWGRLQQPSRQREFPRSRQ
jgi:hypothetical protein